MAYLTWLIPDDLLPGPIDGIFHLVPMADILGVISISFTDVLESMENYHGVPPPDDRRSIGRINTLKQVIAAHSRQSYRDRACQGQGERIKRGNHRLMADWLYKIWESDRKYREALYDLVHYLEVGEPVPSDWKSMFVSPQVFLDYMVSQQDFLDFKVSNPIPPHLKCFMKFWGNRRIRRRNKQRWRRALLRVICAKKNLILCIWNLIHEAMRYDLICSIGMEQGRPYEFSDVSREIDVIVIKVMICLFPHRRFLVTSSIDLVERFHWRFHFYNVEPVIQDGDEPQKYWIQSQIFWICGMDELFTLHVHHGGHFMWDPQVYVGGTIDIVDNCHPDWWSKVEMESICREFGYTEVDKLWFKMPGVNPEHANFRQVVDDDAAMFMTDLVKVYREIHVFVEHPVHEPLEVPGSELEGVSVDAKYGDEEYRPDFSQFGGHDNAEFTNVDHGDAEQVCVRRAGKAPVVDDQVEENSEGREDERSDLEECKSCGKLGHNKRSCKGEVGGNSSLPGSASQASRTTRRAAKDVTTSAPPPPTNNQSNPRPTRQRKKGAVTTEK